MRPPAPSHQPLRSQVFDELKISDSEFHHLQGLVRTHTGIALSEHKRSLMASRLGKRLRALGLGSFKSYYDYLVGEAGQAELENFVNAVTTNKTDFFREKHHFDFLVEELIPELKARAAKTGGRRIRIWSAGCSSGEEPYTIAMVLQESLGNLLTWDARILASDIDTDVLARAAQGIYPVERVVDIPRPTLERHFLRGVGARAGQVRVSRELRDLIAFRQINLLEAPWPIRTAFDCIFCRNVIIYFDKPTVRRLVERFASHLTPDGYLIMGHSESLYGMTEQFRFLRNTIYRHLGKGEAAPLRAARTGVAA